MSKTFSIYDQSTKIEYLAVEEAVGEVIATILPDLPLGSTSVLILASQLSLFEEHEDGKSNRGLWVNGDTPVYVTTAPSRTTGWGRITGPADLDIWGH